MKMMNTSKLASSINYPGSLHATGISNGAEDVMYTNGPLRRQRYTGHIVHVVIISDVHIANFIPPALSHLTSSDLTSADLISYELNDSEVPDDKV